MKYDIDMLAGKLNFEPVVVEKACRIGDILAEIYRDPFLGERLSLTGGTALNLIYGEEIPRISVDLDFNYRHIDSEDWGEARDRIDVRLKAILDSMGYDDLTINPPLSSGKNQRGLQRTDGTKRRAEAGNRIPAEVSLPQRGRKGPAPPCRKGQADRGPHATEGGTFRR